MDFESLLAEFSRAVAAHDTPGLTGLFTPEAAYHDYFFGTHRGAAAIGAMFERFHAGGEQFAWQFLEPVADARTGYSRYRFSYRSREPESRGSLVVFEGMARMRLRDGLIDDYAEVFDRGVAFAQLGYAPARVEKLLVRYAAEFRGSEAAREHLAWRGRQDG